MQKDKSLFTRFYSSSRVIGEVKTVTFSRFRNFHSER